MRRTPLRLSTGGSTIPEGTLDSLLSENHFASFLNLSITKITRNTARVVKTQPITIAGNPSSI
jgi:hypothetical protein